MFKYETHCHTCEVSKCASIPAKELVEFYKTQGYDGIFVTNHFLNGNTSVDRTQSYERQICEFCSGYEIAAEHGKKIGIDVFFGFEYTYFGTDVLVYGLDKNFLLAHPEIMNFKTTDFCNYARDNGALVIHAHPYREASYIDMIRLFPRNVDGVEVYNACRTDFENARAKEYADNYGLIYCGGSDNHIGALPELGGVEFEERITSASDFAAKIKSGKGKVFRKKTG